MRKSKSDHNSFKRFSTGVPDKARRWKDFKAFAAMAPTDSRQYSPRFAPGNVDKNLELVEALRGRPANIFRRRKRGDVPARLGGSSFTVRYHRSAEIRRAMAPWFSLKRRRGIGLFVPPSAAEPWISRHPAVLRFLDRLDRLLARPLALLSDHVLYRFERTVEVAP